MSLTVQKGFWQDKVLAATRQKLAALYYKNPSIVETEKRVILEFWQEYEGLGEILDDKLPLFISWLKLSYCTKIMNKISRNRIFSWQNV